jgi:hypothetical protein
MSYDPLSFDLTRRDFIRASAGIFGAVFVPLTTRHSDSHFVLKKASGVAWCVDDPVSWSLENARIPILNRARQQLLTLSSSESDRIRRLITRRCGLNLIHIQSPRVEVQYWNQLGLADLRPFFKSQGLTKDNIEVVVIDRKRELSEIRNGSDYLYGAPISEGISFESYWKKWRRRHSEESDDWTAAPLSPSRFGWRNVEPNFIPWAALKSMWRQPLPLECSNCDRPTIITKIDSTRIGMSYSPRRSLTHACVECRRLHELPIDKNWILANLE